MPNPPVTFPALFIPANAVAFTNVDGTAQTVSAAAPLPVSISGGAGTQPISAVSLPLPTGAATAVDCVNDGEKADRALCSGELDLLILDLGLPRLGGLDVLKRLRGRASKVPVLILTAADSVEERVKGLDYGADDYMAKPFSLQELEARVRALTRRGMGGTSSSIKHGPLVYDQTGRVATIDGKMVELSARELGLLEVLLQRSGRLVSKDQLVERLCEWGEEVSNNAIEVYIHRLRKKIEKGPIRIATVRGLGYCLEKIPG